MGIVATFYAPCCSPENKKTSKVQVVFNGSGKPWKDDLSLNGCLDFLDTIVKFRRNPVGLIADVEKGFSHILIAPDIRKMVGLFSGWTMSSMLIQP